MGFGFDRKRRGDRLIVGDFFQYRWLLKAWLCLLFVWYLYCLRAPRGWAFFQRWQWGFSALASYSMHCLFQLRDWKSNKCISRLEIWQAATRAHWLRSRFCPYLDRVIHSRYHIRLQRHHRCVAAATYGGVIVRGPVHQSEPSSQFIGSVFNTHCVNSHLLSVHTDVCWHLNGSTVSPRRCWCWGSGS